MYENMEVVQENTVDSSFRRTTGQDSFDGDSSFVKQFSETSKSEIRAQKRIAALLDKIPELNDIFYLHNKVGEGTFSTVYLATLRKHPFDVNKQYAIKHLVPTSNPARIGQELRCLISIGGKDNVVGLEKCIRKHDNVVFVMPYLPHEKFSTYMMSMGVDELRLYMRNLLLALRRVHSFNIIHRDVKPSNFLYDRVNKRFLLVDFGLAEQVGKKTVSEKIAESIAASKKRKRSIIDENENGSANDQSVQHVNKRQALQPLTNTVNGVPVFKKPLTNENRPQLIANSCNVTSIKLSPLKSNSAIDSKQNCGDFLSPKRQPLSTNSANVQINVSPQKLPRVNLFNDKNKVENENLGNSLVDNEKSKTVNKTVSPGNKSTGKVFQTLLPTKLNTKSLGSSFIRVQNSQVKPVFTRPLTPSIPKDRCDCDGKPQVCNRCLVRQRQVAPRAGTPGFRPPEVLLKYPSQTTAVDIWAAGVILLSIVSGCYPFFRSSDDITSLAEIIYLFGTSPIKKMAAKYGKILHCSFDKEGENLQSTCERLRRRKQEAADMQSRNVEVNKCGSCGLFDFPADGCGCYENKCTTSEQGIFPDSAYDLLGRMLDLDPDTRITADEALKHPFLNESEL